MAGVAVVSVFDKEGLADFVPELIDLGYTILSTGGTAKHLAELGCAYTSVSEYTGHPEILDGRVKSLHPKIHGGILARRNRKDDLEQLAQNDISAIDLVLVNLYPFTQKIQEACASGSSESLIESIDIGGPTLIRAAAKNCEFVIPICDPADYPRVLDELKSKGEVSQETRRALATKVFTMMARYDAAIARYFSLDEKILTDDGQPQSLAPIESLVLERVTSLRYGENPHQSAALYRSGNCSTSSWWKQTQGKELSYNNLLDMQGALELFLELRRDAAEPKTAKKVAVVIKHSNPCGVALGNTPVEAFELARACDPLSAFGGIVAVEGEVDAALATSVNEGFVEVLLVESVSADAAEILLKKKNMRVLVCDFDLAASSKAETEFVVRNSMGEYLLQTPDLQLNAPSSSELVVGSKLEDVVAEDLDFAWKICKYVKSNAIVLVKNGIAIGVGAGQMSRVDAAKIAIQRAQLHGHDVKGSVAASDAFLPFPDTLELLNDAGVCALAQPGGSIKDKAVIESAQQRDMVMVFTGERHFRH
jgi:phosphoribosylaminoimidazolecarboxamide formyltransferase/IMP cyclohydrolase